LHSLKVLIRHAVHVQHNFTESKGKVTRIIAWRLLIWRIMRLWLHLPLFKGRNRVFFEFRHYLTDPGHFVLNKTDHGFQMKLNLADEVDAEVYLFGEFDPTTTIVAKSITRPGDCVIDAGANVGYFSLLFASMIGADGLVTAFEPSPTTYKRLATNLELNPKCRTISVQSALGEHIGQATLIQQFRERSGDAITVWSDMELGKSSIKEVFAEHVVAVDTIDDYCQRNDLAPTIIKVDVEGADLPLLRGSEQILRTSQPILILELNEAAVQKFGYQLNDMTSWLRETCGYKLFNIGNKQLLPLTSAAPVSDDEQTTMNVLAVIPEVHSEQFRMACQAISSERHHTGMVEVWPAGRVAAN